MGNEKNPNNKEHGKERMIEQALEVTQGVIRQLQSVEAQKGDPVERGKQHAGFAVPSSHRGGLK